MAHEKDSLEERARQADKIVREPGKYKVCEGCDSIVAVTVALCPNCHSYRYNADRASIISQARILGQREQQSVIASDLE